MRRLILGSALGLATIVGVLVGVERYERILPSYRARGPIALTARTAETLQPTVATIVAARGDGAYLNHVYLAFWRGRFWAIWSQGMGEDLAGQRVMLAWSRDAIAWSRPAVLAASPRRAMIARGLWVDEDWLHAFAADATPDLFEALSSRPAGTPLATVVTNPFTLDRPDGRWRRGAPILPSGLTNYPPVFIGGERWLVLRTPPPARVMQVAIDRGGDWRSPSIADVPSNPLSRSNEPIAYPVGQQRYILARSDGVLKRLFYAERRPDGRWSARRPTGFPGVSAKFFAIDTPRDGRLLIGNFEPQLGRHMLVIAQSLNGGRTYSSFYRLGTHGTDGLYHTLVYPHSIVVGDRLFIAVSKDKRGIVLLTVPLPLRKNVANWPGRAVTALTSFAGRLRTRLRGPYD